MKEKPTIVQSSMDCILSFLLYILYINNLEHGTHRRSELLFYNFYKERVFKTTIAAAAQIINL
jgi:hypothetical protein